MHFFPIRVGEKKNYLRKISSSTYSNNTPPLCLQYYTLKLYNVLVQVRFATSKTKTDI